MRVGVLTGGGDCPGLNAVLRAIVRKAERVHGDEVLRLPRRLARRDRERLRDPRRSNGSGARCHAAARSSAPRGSPRTWSRTVLERVRATVEANGARRADRHRWRGHAVVWSAGLERRPRPGGRGPQDDRQRHRRHRDDLRVRHRRRDRHRRHRPPAHHRRVPRPGHGGRGHGSPRRPHRPVGRHRRWGDDDAHPRGALRHRRPWPRPSGAVTSAGKYASIVVVAEGARPKPGTLDIAEPVIDEYGHQRLGGIANVVAQRDRGPHRLRHPGRRCWATCSAADTPTAFDRVLCTLVRDRGDRRRPRRCLRLDGGAPERRCRAGPAGRGRRRTSRR